MVQNKAFIYKKIPNGWPVKGQDLTVEDIGFDENAPPPKNGFTTKNVRWQRWQRLGLEIDPSESCTLPLFISL